MAKSADRKRRKALSPTKWKQLIKEYSNSGLSQAEFCRRNNLSTSSFYQWVKKLFIPSEGKLLLPLSVIPEASAASGCSVLIQDRYLVNLEPNFNAETLVQLLKVLDRL